MKNSYKMALLAALGIVAATAAQAQSTTPDPVLLGMNDANTANDYVLQIGTANQFTTTAVLGGSLNISGNTISSVFGGDASYLNNVNVGAFGGNNGSFGDTTVLETADLAALQTTTPGGVSSSASLYAAVPLGSSAKSGSSSWDSIVEVGPTTIGSSLEGSVSGDDTGLFMNTAVSGNYSEQVYWTDPQAGQDINGNNFVTDLGTLNVNLNNGTWSFDGSSVAVPEPSTYGLIAGAGLLLVGVRRQFAKKNA